MIYKKNTGFSLIELLIAMSISSILALSVGVLLIGGQRSWAKIYNDANSEMRQGSYAIMTAFGSIGRQSNRLNYTLYTKEGNKYIPSTASGGNEQIVYGDAVEFRYWAGTQNGTSNLDTSNTGTDYAFFYIEDKKMKVDYGKVIPPGAVPSGGGPKNTVDIATTVLADNVVPNPKGAFNHTVIGGVGQGSVRIDVTIEDDNDSDNNVRVMTTTLLRNIWPR